MSNATSWQALLAMPEQEQTAALMTTLRAVVDEFGPDYVYEGPCVYERGGKPACIAAQVFVRHGVSIETLQHWDGTDVTDSTIRGLWDTGVLSLSEKARDCLAAAQTVQDEHLPWGEALASAEEIECETINV